MRQARHGTADGARRLPPGLSIYLLGVFIGALDTGVLGPAFPLIAHGFGVTLRSMAWSLTVYTVAYVASTVLAGAIGDRYGRRRVFAWGVAAFGAASVLAAVSGAFWVFLAARVIQGAGAGAVYPNAQAEGVRQFPAERRGTALGIFGAVFGLASIIGPNVGGALAQFLGWRSVFLVNVPIAVACLLLVPRLAPSPRSTRPMPDWQGGASFGALLAAALLAIALPGPRRLVAAVAAAALLGWFLLRQRRARTPFLDAGPLRGPGGFGMVVGAALIGVCMAAAIFVPTLAQRELHFSVLASGAALLPAALAGAVLAGAGGVLVDRVGPRGVLQAGLLAGVAGGLMLAAPHLGVPLFMLAMVAFGISTAFTMGAPLNRMALGLYHEEQAGQALSLVAVFRSVGLAAGPVVLTLLEHRGGFSAMFGGVAVAALLGFVLFFLVPDVRPARRALGVPRAEAE